MGVCPFHACVASSEATRGHWVSLGLELQMTEDATWRPARRPLGEGLPVGGDLPRRSLCPACPEPSPLVLLALKTHGPHRLVFMVLRWPNVLVF